MLQAKDLMTAPVLALRPNDPIFRAIDLLLQHRLSSLPVVDEAGRLIGVVSELELLDLFWDPERSSSEVYQYMTGPVHGVDETDPLDCVAERFRLLGLRQLPVMRGSQMVGMLARRDLLPYLQHGPQHLATRAA